MVRPRPGGNEGLNDTAPSARREHGFVGSSSNDVNGHPDLLFSPERPGHQGDRDGLERTQSWLSIGFGMGPVRGPRQLVVRLDLILLAQSTIDKLAPPAQNCHPTA